MGKGKGNIVVKLGVLLALLAGGWLAFGAIDGYAATGLQGRCGMHIGSLIRRSSGGSWYHFRVGPKYPGNTVRPGTCRGYVRVVRKGMHLPQVGALAWQHYSMLHYKAKTALLITGAIGTVSGCSAMAKYMVAGISALVDVSSEGVAFPGVALMAGTVGCGVGAHWLYARLSSGPDNLNRVRMVK